MACTVAGNEREIVRFLKKAGCCLRCCLRFIGSRNAEFYKDPVSSLQKLKYLDEAEVVDNVPCIVCLGILQEDLLEVAIQKASEEIIAGNYDCDTFTVALTIPVTTILRERSLQIYLGQSLTLPPDLFLDLKLHTQSIKEVWKIFSVPKIEELTKKIGESGRTFSPFLVDILFSHSCDEEECVNLLQKCNTARQFNARRRNADVIYSRKNVEATLETLNDEQFEKHCPIPPKSVESFASFDKVICAHSSIYIGGRYKKMSRNLCQTPWLINGEKKCETSVQELLCDSIVKYAKADSMKFLSSGREDVDVRTLNDGRPFAVELVNPRVTKIPDDLRELVLEINESTEDVKVANNLKVLSKLDLKKLKEGENEKTKNYRALCIYKPKPDTLNLIQGLNDLTKLKIIQKTPMRVLHRRPLVPRVRIVHSMRARLPTPEELTNFAGAINNLGVNNIFILDLKTQAGTYVKEFVHGDFGRTVPSLCDLLQTEVDIIALDVTGINLNWP